MHHLYHDTNPIYCGHMNIRRLLSGIVILSLLAITACSEPDHPTIGLYPALQRGDIDQIKRHIYWGADLNQPDPDGHMPLHAAAEAGRFVVVKLLLKHGAKINAPDQHGHTPLYAALMAGRTQVAQLLIKQGALFDANQLLFAVLENQVADRDVIEFLTDQGADIDHRNDNGDTPLLMAVKRGYRVLSKQLIAHGAEVNIQDSDGHTPLWYALEQNNQDIARLLKRNGAVGQ